MRLTLVILSALALSTAASASCGVAYVAPVKAYQAYVAPVVATYVPIYGATYSPVPGIDAESLKVIIEALKAPQQAQQAPPDNAAILEAIRKLNERLDRLEKPTMPTVPANPFDPPARKESRLDAAGKCLLCHDRTNADSKGGGFVLPGAGHRDMARAAELVRAGRMPPRSSGVAFSDYERQAFLAMATK